MPKVQIDIGLDSYKNIDEISTKNGVSPLLFDGYKDDAGSDIKRHGYRLFKDLASGGKVDGLFWSKKHKTLYAVSNGTVYRVTKDGTATSLGSGLEVGDPVQFTEDATYVFMANGGRIHHIAAGDASITPMADGDAPDTVIGLGYIDTYLLASTTTRTHYSDPGDPLSWGVTSFFTPESRPDGINSLQVWFREVTMFGPESIDVYYNDGVSPFARLDGAFLEKGCIAGNSVVRQDNTFYFLDDRKQVSILIGRQTKSVSDKINKEIGSYDKVDDAIGHIVTMFGKEFYVLQFPTEGKTWAFDMKLNVWSQWSSWSIANAERQAFRMNAHAYAIDWDEHIIGDLVNAKLYTWTDDIFSDDGEEIRFERITGHINHDTFNRKRCNFISLKVKRGIDSTIAANTREGKMLVKHRNDGELWSNEKTVSLGYDGDTDIVVRLWRQGLYRARQWSVVHTDPTPFKLANPIEEDVDLLGN